MKNWISVRFASLVMITILSLIIIFHLLIIVGVIPYDLVWGGRLNSSKEMWSFETVSIALNILMFIIVSIRGGFLNWNMKPLALKISLWAMFILFSLNTVGNLVSLNSLETVIFTPLTILFALFSLRLAVD